MVVGGFTAITYGEFRFTADVDIVVDMQHRHVDYFVAAFPIPEHTISRDGIMDSLIRRYPFNVIKPDTGAKVDWVPLPAEPLTRAAFTRRQRFVYDEETGQAADFATASPVFLTPNRWFRLYFRPNHVVGRTEYLPVQNGRGKSV